jgi:hypothetical protein
VPIAVGHHQIGDDHVVRRAPQKLARLIAIGRGVAEKPFLGQCPANQSADNRLIVHDERSING